MIGGAVALGTRRSRIRRHHDHLRHHCATTRHITCARAPRALTKINKVEAAVTKRLPKLQAAETKFTTAGHTKRAARVEKRISRLQKAETKAGALAHKIDTKCPAATAS